MPATVNLLPRKAFEITLEDGTIIKGQFGTWALKRFCDKNKVGLTEAGTALQTLGGIVDYLLSAVEYVARLGGHPFSYTDIHVCQWADEMGGIDSASFTSLLKHSQDEAAGEDEKKTDS